MSALVFLAPGFEEIEGVTVIDVLRRAEIETVVAGLVTNPIMAARQTRHLADLHLADVDPAREFEIVVLPGGAEGAKNLAQSRLVGNGFFVNASAISGSPPFAPRPPPCSLTAGCGRGKRSSAIPPCRRSLPPARFSRRNA